jgi:hypothetical protein
METENGKLMNRQSPEKQNKMDDTATLWSLVSYVQNAGHKALNMAAIQIVYLFVSSKFSYPELCSVPGRSICNIIAN